MFGYDGVGHGVSCHGLLHHNLCKLQIPASIHAGGSIGSGASDTLNTRVQYLIVSDKCGYSSGDCAYILGDMHTTV